MSQSTGEVDPVERGTGVVGPRLQEAAEQGVVQVLVVETQEAQVHASALTLGDVRLGGAERQLADLLPVGIGGTALAHARDLEQLGP